MRTHLKSFFVFIATLVFSGQMAMSATISASVSARVSVNDNRADGQTAFAIGSYDFSGETVSIVGSGSACNGGCGNPANWYTPDGTTAILIEGRPAFSLIGRWGSTTSYSSTYSDAFLVGSSLTVDAPTALPAYLFLGFNDNYYADNAGSFSVNITSAPTAPPVPLPSGVGLLLSALGIAALAWRRWGRAPA